jgi:glycerophosphoryl diester phosphodiesterase
MIAHRGERITAPENTIEGCCAAIEQGADALEVDVRLCAGGEVVLYHDKTLKQHFNTYTPLSFSTIDELKKLTFQRSAYTVNAKIPTLCEFLEEFRGKVPINLDAKTFYTDLPHLAGKLVKEIQAMNLKDQVWISAFNPLFITIVKQINRSIRTGYLFRNFERVHRFINIVSKADAWHPHYTNVSARFVDFALKHQKEIYVWSVNKPDVMKTMKQYPINGIITDVFFRKKVK